MSEPGPYHADEKLHRELVEALYAKYPEGVTLPPEYASFVEGNLLRLLIRLARYKFVTRMLRPTDSVLEVGCGSGVGTIYLAQHCAEVRGIDVDERELKEAISINRRANVRFEVADFFHEPADRTYDVIVALDVIEHMDDETGERLLDCVARHLADGGLLVLGTPSVYSYPYQGELSRASHIKLYDLEELLGVVERRFARAVGFSMNDELVHTGFPKLAWYYFVLGFGPRTR